MINFSISSEDFRNNYLERQPLHLPASLKQIPDAVTELARSLSAARHADGRVNIFHNGAPLPFDLFTDTVQDVSDVRRKISIPRVESLLAQGATVSVSRIDQDVPFARSACDEVQLFTGEVATANCYAAMAGTGTFGAHWDTHDVIALQLSGRKHWRIWRPTHHLPVPGQGSRNQNLDLKVTPALDLILECGDALYIPRGWWHEAVPVSATQTIHLAIGLHASTMSDYVTWLASNVLVNFPQLRRGLFAASRTPSELESSTEIIRMAFLESKNLESYSRAHQKLLEPRPTYFHSSFKNLQPSEYMPHASTE